VPEQLLLDFPECVLPSCTNAVLEPGEVCAECIEAFDGYLQRSTMPQLTAEQIQQRDEATRQALRAQVATKASAPALERKQNQACWMCDERRTCTRMPSGWECDPCRDVR
jgi:hypothetical protein